MGKGIQITNTVILGLIAILLTLFTIIVLLASLATGEFQGFLNFSSVIYFLIWITSVIYFILLLMSFKKCNIENKYFKWAFWLNVTWIVLGIILFLGVMIFILTSKSSATPQEAIFGSLEVVDKANKFFDMVEPILGLIYFISFIVFVIGYFKNKKGRSSSPRQF